MRFRQIVRRYKEANLNTDTVKKNVSVIVPCYKVEQYLPRCLDSLVNQTLENYEIICVNDGSPDNCLNILRDYEARFPDKMVVIDKKNEGTWRGRKDAIEIAQGEYIGFLDSDDYVDRDFLKNLYEAAKLENADIAVCGFKRVDMDTGKVLSTELSSPRSSFVISEKPGLLLELNGAPWNKLFKSEYLKNMDDLKTIPPIFDDMMLHLLAYKNMEGVVVFVPEAPIHYMVRSDSIINTICVDQIGRTRDAMLEVRDIYHRDCSKEMIEMLNAMAFLHFGISLSFRLSSDKTVNIKEYLRSNRQFLDDNFQTWSSSPYLTLEYAKQGNGSLKRVVAAKRAYDIGIFPLLLKAYSWMISNLHMDIKW